MTNSESRQEEITEHTIRFERFMYEMDSIEDITTEIHELIEIKFDPIIVQHLKNRIKYFDLMVAQLKSDATKWGLELKKDMRLLEEVVGECDLDYEWIFESCDIHWLTERYWQHCPQSTLRATRLGYSTIIDSYPLDYQNDSGDGDD